MDLWQRLDDVADRWNVLRHPFYQRWSEGDLTPSELAFYAGQYGYAVDALASASRHAADIAPPAFAGELGEHAAEEEAHRGLWRSFAEAAGGEAKATPLPETADCAAAWSAPERVSRPRPPCPGAVARVRGPEALRLLGRGPAGGKVAPLAAIARRVKAALDPSAILNPGRMHVGL